MKKDEQEKPWFESWFATDLYDLMYQHRDYAEAEYFLDNLLAFMKPNADDQFLDLACGTGRHSRYIHSKGYAVTGVDLSARSIALAQEHATDDLTFHVQDMREPLREQAFDLVLNLFTSFGYFDDVADNDRVLQSVYASLKPDGRFLLDFFNATVVTANLVHEEQKTIGEWQVDITREAAEDRLVKTMKWQSETKEVEFSEKVSLFSKDDLCQMLERAGFTIEHVFGDYSLNPFDETTSPRVLLLCRR